jgi:hypothetical protein
MFAPLDADCHLSVGPHLHALARDVRQTIFTNRAIVPPDTGSSATPSVDWKPVVSFLPKTSTCLKGRVIVMLFP